MPYLILLLILCLNVNPCYAENDSSTPEDQKKQEVQIASQEAVDTVWNLMLQNKIEELTEVKKKAECHQSAHSAGDEKTQRSKRGD